MHKIFSNLKGFLNFEFNSEGDSTNDAKTFCYGHGYGFGYGYGCGHGDIDGSGFGVGYDSYYESIPTPKTLSMEPTNA
jgi:hypothetical protein